MNKKRKENKTKKTKLHSSKKKANHVTYRQVGVGPAWRPTWRSHAENFLLGMKTHRFTYLGVKFGAPHRQNTYLAVWVALLSKGYINFRPQSGLCAC